MGRAASLAAVGLATAFAAAPSLAPAQHGWGESDCGLPREMLKPGATATVEGYASRGKPEEMRAACISIQGKTIELR